MKIASLVSLVLLLSGQGYASPTRAADKGATAGRRQFSVATTAYIPFRRRLRKQKVSRSVVDAQARYTGSPAPLLNEVVRLVPHYFPPQARVLSVRQVGSAKQPYFLVDLNKAFSNARFWKNRKRYECRLAFHALARNVAFRNEGKGKALPVRFAIDGQLVSRIGSFKTSQVLVPEKIAR